ncbi:hypothetical protein WS45_28675 [Burkholderia sp. RF2-non_BP3]|nr:hypothetical protein WS45_28675 [Burkholderia sp. RF2-non_BP3]
MLLFPCLHCTSEIFRVGAMLRHPIRANVDHGIECQRDSSEIGTYFIGGYLPRKIQQRFFVVDISRLLQPLIDCIALFRAEQVVARSTVVSRNLRAKMQQCDRHPKVAIRTITQNSI